MTDHKKERFARWQRLSIEYLSYSINLFLGMSIATIGFELNLLRDNEFTLGGYGKCAFILSLLLQIISSTSGIACVLNRVEDFRKTTVKVREKSKEDYDDKLDKSKEADGVIGAGTRCLFTSQVYSFSIGVFLLIVVMGTLYGEKLF